MGGESHDFPSKFFCLTVPEYFVGEPFSAVFRKISGIEKNGKREVEHQDYPSKFFWSLIAENFRRRIFYCCINLGCRKSLVKKNGVSRFSVEDFLVSLVLKFSEGKSFTAALILGIEKVWIEGGGRVSRFSVENYLSHSAENFRRGILYCCINFR